MITFKEWLIQKELNEGINIQTRLKQYDWAESEPVIKKLGKAFGEEVGVFNFKDNKYRYIYDIKDELSKGAFKYISLKDGEYLVRYVTPTSAIGHGQAPLIKINPSKGLVWFLKDYDADADDLEFETKSQKITSIRTSLK